MPPTLLCIVARSMRRLLERARISTVLSVVLASSVALGSLGCEQLDARNRIRKGNRAFHDTQFIDAAAEYQRALKAVDDPIIHYNLGLAYSKVFKPGYTAPVLLGTKDDFVCQEIPGVRVVEASACVKPGDRRFAECGATKTAPLEKAVADLDAKAKAETDEAKKKDLQTELKDKRDELGRYTCASSFRCVEGPQFCALSSPEIAELAAQNFQVWIKAQLSDDEIKKGLTAANAELERAKKADNKSAQASAQRTVDELLGKDQIRKLMTQLWMESEQHQKAIDYWEGLLKDKPNDSAIIGTIAGIYISKGDWRKGIEYYNKGADVANDASSKIANYQYIGNVAWSKLNQKTLVGVDAIELADSGIAALQRGVELQSKNFRLISLQASIFNFRSTAHGASWAAAIDRASAQDLSKLARVLSEEAKKAQGQPPPAPAAPEAPATAPATAPAPSPAPSPPGAAPNPTPAPATGGSAEKSGG